MNMDPLERAVAKALLETQSNLESKPVASNIAPIASKSSDSAAITPLPNLDAEKTHVEVDSNSSKLGNAEQHLSEDVLKNENIVGHLQNGPHANIFHVLQSQVSSKLTNNNCQVLAMLGATESVGKSYTALNLALSMAKDGGHMVTLVDLDLRQPSIANTLKVDLKYGITDYFEEKCGFEQACLRTQFQNIEFFLGNRPVDNASELLGTPRAQGLIQRIQQTRQSFIIVDLPPIIGIPDTHSFLPNCDAALLVIEYAKTSTRHLEEVMRLIRDVPLVGSVVNKGLDGNLSSYGYGYGSKKS